MARQDYSGAMAMFKKACDGGYAPACAQQGRMYGLGLGTAKNPEQAARLLRRACQGGVKGACGSTPYRKPQPAATPAPAPDGAPAQRPAK